MRPAPDIVAELIPTGSHVLDLGCGRGDLLAYLLEERLCTGTGVETDPDAVLSAIRRGVSVIEVDIDEQLGEFADSSYDVVVMSLSLQATRRPAAVLREIGRIGRQCILSVPNSGGWRHRVGLRPGREMPASPGLPHRWHETPTIHPSTLADLEALFTRIGMSVEQRVLLDRRAERLRSRLAGNLRAVAATYMFSAGR